MKRHITLALAAAASICVSAQDLQKEITVDRYVLPQTREASRLSGFAPRLFQPEVQTKRLNVAEYAKSGKITNEAAQLPPAPWLDSIASTPWCGYASLGYFPLSDIGADIGYRVYRDSRADVGVWAQFINNRYKGSTPANSDSHFGNTYISAGVNGSYRLEKSTIGLEADFTRAGVITPVSMIQMGYLINDKYTQTADIADVKAGWTGSSGLFSSHASAGYSYFDFGEDAPPATATILPSIRQTMVNVTAGTGYCDEEGASPWIGVDIDWDFVRSGGMLQHESDLTYYDVARYTLGHVRPYLNFGEGSSLSGHIGLNLSVATGNDNGHLRVAPDIEVNWQPLSWFDIYGKASGGEHINSIRTLFDINPYISTDYGYERTNVALQLEVGGHLIPFSGLRLSGYGRYARVRGQLIPLVLISSSLRQTSIYEQDDANSWVIGASADYSCNLFGVGAHVDMASSNNKYVSWYTWHDGAKYVAGAYLSVRPISPLEVKAGIEVRAHRRCGIIDYRKDDVNPDKYPSETLRRLTDLTLSARYDINSRLSAFLTGENLLNKHWLLVSGMPARGIHGLVGASYKF